MGIAITVKVLVLTSEAITAQQLRGALGTDGDPSDLEVMVVAPALADNALQFWMSDADEAIANAERVARESVDALGAEGVPVAGDVGESDLGTAIRDALATFPAERVILFTHPPDEGRYREEADPGALAEEVGVAVERFEVRGS